VTKAAAIALVADRLGNRQGMDERIARELDASQILLESGPFHPWFMRKDLSLSVSTQSFSLPADFIAPLEDQELLLSLDTGKPLVPIHDWQVGPKLRLAEPGLPSFYVLGPASIFLYPPPDKEYRFTFSYYASQPSIASLGSNDTNTWLTYAPLVLANHAGAKVAAHLRSPDTATLFQAGFDEAMQQLLRADAAWRANSRIYKMGG